MKLILEAIKALFRKLENSIPKTLADLLGGEKISGNMVKEMYYQEPPKIYDILPKQTYETPELTADDDFVRTDGVATYGCDVPGFDPEAVGVNENALGEVFTVLWDGVEYNCTAHDGDGLEYFCLGNANIVNARKDDSGEPFCILMDIYWGKEVKLHIRTNEPGAHTVFVCVSVPGEIHPVPEKYIPMHSHSPADIWSDNGDVLSMDALPIVPITKGGTGATAGNEALRKFGFAYVSSASASLGMIAFTISDYNPFVGSLLTANMTKVADSTNNLYFYVNQSKKYYIYDSTGANLRAISKGCHIFVYSGNGFTLVV